MILGEFIGLVTVVVLATIQGRIGRAGSVWMILFALPSTFLHELAHYLVALVTGGRPSRFSVFPRSTIYQHPDGRTQKIWVLGSVQSQMGLFSAFPTAVAPLVYIPAAFFLFQNWYDWYPSTLGSVMALYGISYLFLTSSIPSSADWRIVTTYPGSALLYGGLVCVGYIARPAILSFLGFAVG